MVIMIGLHSFYRYIKYKSTEPVVQETTSLGVAFFAG